MESTLHYPYHSPAQPSPHGVIGQPYPAQSSTIDRNRNGNADIDITSLLAQAHAHQGTDRSHLSDDMMSTSRFSVGPVPSTSRLWLDATSAAGVNSNYTHTTAGDNIGTGGMHRQSNAGIQSRLDAAWDRGIVTATPRVEIWSSGSPTQYLNTATKNNNNNNVGGTLVVPKTAPLPLPQPMASTSTSSPAVDRTSDTASQITQHLYALQDLVKPLITTADEVEALRREVSMWKNQWNLAQNEVAGLGKQIQELQHKLQVPKLVTGPTFTAVLIDGDGLIFQDSYLKQGHAGGQQAARALLSALPELVLTASPIVAEGSGRIDSDDQNKRSLGNVIVHLFLHKSGLGTALTKAGCVSSWGVYESFWQGFSSAHDLFTVIDVGPGKEASDSKIREYVRHYASNVQCENIILGVSHDNGYATVLSSLETESRLNKVLILKGYSDLAPQLLPYASKVISIPDLFRTERIASTPAISFSAVAAAKKSVAPVPTSTTASATHPKPKPKTTAAPAPAPAASESDESTDSSLQSSTTASPETTISALEVEVFEWDKLVIQDDKAKSVKKAKSPGAGEGWVEAKSSTWKKGKKKDSSGGGGGSDSGNITGGGGGGGWKDKVFKEGKGWKGSKGSGVRDLQPRPCHSYYLGSNGCKNDDCNYGHDYDLNDQQLDELHHLAKQIPCPFKRNRKCFYSDEKCVYGHRCPRGGSCTFEDCRFEDIDPGHAN